MLTLLSCLIACRRRIVEPLNKLLVLGSQFQDGGARGFEGGELLAGEDVVIAPVVGEGKGRAYASILGELAWYKYYIGKQPTDTGSIPCRATGR